VHGSDELYLVARTELPPASWYGDFEQVENGVGSVRYLQGRVSSYDGRWPALAGRRVAVVTGSAMGRLMPRVTQDLAHRTGARFEVIALDNSLFGPSVTTAGLLPGEAFQRALAHRTDLDLALLPAESLNDDHIFLDDLSAEALARALPFPIHFSHDFGDALAEPAGA
jgi:NifB/MoaA-like Fe-S oxidoreductase